MEDITVRISRRFKEAIDDVADQLDTSVKSVVDMILQWFFDTDWGDPERILEALGDVNEDDEDQDDEDDVEGPDFLGELLGIGDDDEEDDEEEE